MSCVYALRNASLLFEHQVSNNKITFCDRNEMASIKVCFVKYLLPQTFDVQYIDVFEKPMGLRVFDLKAKFITSDRTVIRRF